MFIDCVLMTGRGQMTMLCTLIRGHLIFTTPFFSWGAHVLLCQFLGGQMSSYAIFHRGAHVRGGGGGKCPTLIYIIVDFQDSAAEILNIDLERIAGLPCGLLVLIQIKMRQRLFHERYTESTIQSCISTTFP